ncbi:hypothetical protein HRR90_005425 [Exophiala dermatitidis]|uniref:Uncharacterized protein n=1 Tax=Exophiala dermatitidis TaxID=5970 RepID=A0AAN6EPB4_EXODE|nr:hypothetical protein HRR76_006808 [Exophiala dermatitidis]KAJ4535972.1 hypothetical protein HRR77_007422 [Exophiala dermatitidis]KAJ4601017.1 hypothetical protein HRR84_002899 [Exophiala dermatitidis]KAJ4620662.1 hypothetical protein HRR86_006538 [Exophiala dermatitidis]KAJ4627996.1 hypothetical protein HRR88_003312 [Exophiala dermatitidis]
MSWMFKLTGAVKGPLAPRPTPTRATSIEDNSSCHAATCLNLNLSCSPSSIALIQPNLTVPDVCLSWPVDSGPLTCSLRPPIPTDPLGHSSVVAAIGRSFKGSQSRYHNNQQTPRSSLHHIDSAPQ